jgi:hypothetical protein
MRIIKCALCGEALTIESEDGTSTIVYPCKTCKWDEYRESGEEAYDIGRYEVKWNKEFEEVI